MGRIALVVMGSNRLHTTVNEVLAAFTQTQNIQQKRYEKKEQIEKENVSQIGFYLKPSSVIVFAIWVGCFFFTSALISFYRHSVYVWIGNAIKQQQEREKKTKKGKHIQWR